MTMAIKEETLTAIASYQQAVSIKTNDAGVVVEDIRTHSGFLKGYQQGKATTVAGYSADISLSQLVNLFTATADREQQGALAWEIEHRALKLSFKSKNNKFNQLFRHIAGMPRQGDFDHQARHQLAPQGFLLNLSDDGFGGRCEPLSKLMLVARQLESAGQLAAAHQLMEKLYLTAAVINNPASYSAGEQNNARQLISHLKEIQKNAPFSYEYDTVANREHDIVKGKWLATTDNGMTLPQLLNKLIPEADSQSPVPVLLQLDTPVHAMSAWSVTGRQGRIYGFYDPNAGSVEFSSAKKFKRFLVRFFAKNGLNMAERYQLPRNGAGALIFSRVTEFDGDRLAEFKPYRIASDQTTLKDIVLMPILDTPVSPVPAHRRPHVESDIDNMQSHHFDRVMFPDELLKHASVAGKIIGQSYREILASLDKLHTSSAVGQIETAFILQNQIRAYMHLQPDSARNPAFSWLEKQINNALFSGSMQPAQAAIRRIAETGPMLAARLYQAACGEIQGDQPGLTSLLLRWVDEDPRLKPLKGFSGAVPDKILTGFDATFHVALGQQFNDFKSWLLKAQAEGVMVRVYPDAQTQMVHLGYSYSQLDDLAVNDNARMAISFLKAAATEAGGSDSEAVMLDKFANKNYLRRLQIARLAQMETMYHSSHHTDINSWDRQYAGTAGEHLNQRLRQQADISGQLAVLLENRPGLLLSDTEDAGWRFITEHMALLKARGVTTVGLPHLCGELAQPLIDSYFATGVMPGDLQVMVKRYSLAPLFARAYETGLKIVALDTGSTSLPDSKHGAVYRVGAVNNVAVETLNRLPAGEKFIVIYAAAHLGLHPGLECFLPGITHRLGLPGLTVDAAGNLQVLPDDVSQRKIYPDGADASAVIFENWQRGLGDTRQQPASLARRLNKALAVLDALAAGDVTLTRLTPWQRRLMSDFFHTAGGALDVRQLLMSINDRHHYYQVREQLQDLMQSEDTHHQFDGLTGQTARQYSAHWNQAVTESRERLYQVVQKHTTAAVNIRLLYSPQGIYIGDGSPVARQRAADLALAWLYTLSQGEAEGASLRSGLHTHAEINEQKMVVGISATEARQAAQFRTLLTGLSADNTLLADRGQQPLGVWLQQLRAGQDGYYQLTADKHILTLAKHSEQGRTVYCLYDPHVGEVRFDGDHPEQVIVALQSVLNDYLLRPSAAPDDLSLADNYGVKRDSSVQPPDSPFTFRVFQLDVARAAQHVPLSRLQQLLKDGFITEQQRVQRAGNVMLDGVRLSRRTLYAMGVIVDGYRISSDVDVTDTAFTGKLRFNADLLAGWLTTEPAQSREMRQAVRWLKQHITRVGMADGSLLTLSGEPHSAAAIRQLITLLADQANGGQIKKILGGSVYFSRQLKRINRIIGPAGQVNQGIGYLKALLILANYWRRRNSDELNAQQKQALDLEAAVASAGLGWDIGSGITEWGLGKLGRHLTQQAADRVASGLSRYASPLGRLRYQMGTKLARWGIPGLKLVGSLFDIYGAHQSFSRLARETDPDIRTDLKVSGALSTVAAAVGIATLLAIAAGGIAAAIGGPLGVTVGLLISLGGGIYTAARQVADIKQYVKLSTLQEWRSGWLAFWGQDLDLGSEITNSAAYNQALEQARKEYDRLLVEQATQLMVSSNIDIFYYSREDIRLQEHAYKRLMGEEAFLIAHVVRYSSTKILQDKIKPDEGDRVLADYNRKRYLEAWSYRNTFLQDSDYKYYTPGEPQSIDDNINVSGAINADNVVCKLFIGQRRVVGKLSENNGEAFSTELNIMNHDHYGVTGDFNGDGHVDIGYFFRQALYVLLADKKGGYGQAQRVREFDDIVNPRFKVGDINNDGCDDIIFLNIQNININYLTIVLAQRTGEFSTVIQYLPRETIYSRYDGPVSGDLDGDGHADLLLFNRHRVRIYYGMQNGQFTAAEVIDKRITGSYIRHIMADVNGDGRDDVVSFTAEGKIHTLLGSDDRRQKFTEAREQDHPEADTLYRGPSDALNFKSSQIQLYDMNDDGRADLVAVSNDGSYGISYAQADGTFGPVSRDTQREENGRTVFYRPNLLAVKGEQAIIGIAAGRDGEKVLLSMNKMGEINAHPFSPTRIEETTAWFKLGGGSDVVVGYPERRNIFEVAAGTKRFTGGRRADSFLLMGQPAPESPGELDGGKPPAVGEPPEDNDIVMAADKPVQGGGYLIDLKAGEAGYRKSGQLIARLRHIEHAQGHPETDDVLTGDDRDNHLNGVGGQDRLSGHGGNDVLTLQAGTATGGPGTDSYHILHNSLSQDVSVDIHEENDRQENSNILLDYPAVQIESVLLQDNDVVITLRNDNRTVTRVCLKAVYQPVTEGETGDSDGQKNLAVHYILYTRDGLVISGWPEVLSAGSGPGFLLTAQYRPELDRGWQERIAAATGTGGTAPDIRVHLQRQAAAQPGQITVGGSTVLLPAFIRLAMLGSRS